ncbi:HAMP domain-containing methyl-accepting chemotaxis protein [Telmatospirillum sp.]|uniref:methyl-accepting chemotaxis protein n=1 Tax=Telmatospirillum sp. TaxID=2079197 RepID=UPI0028418AE2|nr:HAMP domain-containing methyl-accepting chemotaxis protein [Telmatospirillum sp.]MDR3437359.1 HAMP domain-containing methyl-accepting chemotaxis protein [Telmatospirillum sp.]
MRTLENLRLGAKLMLTMGVTVLAVAALVTVANIRAMESVIDRAESAELEGHFATMSESIEPAIAQGRQVGSGEFGMTFAKNLLDTFKARRHVDVALHLFNGDKVEALASTFGGASLASQATLTKAFAGDPLLTRVTTAQGVPLAVYAGALTDSSGRRIGVLEIAMDRSQFVTAVADARYSALIIALLALALGLALAAAAARNITRRLQTVADGVHRVAKGDLGADVAVDGNDEVGMLGHAAAEMRSQLHDLVTELRTHAFSVHNAAQEISGAVKGQAVTSSQMSSSVAEITSTMEELSASSTQIAEHSKSVVDIANQTWEESKKGAEAMDLVMSKMKDIQQDNENSLKEIMELGSRSKEISKVMAIINTIADQTKLIAFNAALEAASAGDAGRRFGVVAAEIRRLADSVTDSTGEIETKVNQIQDSINRLIITSEKGVSGTADGMTATANTAAVLGEMVGAARQTTSAAQQISLSTQQQKTASNQVVVALREIVSASSHTAQSISRISDISRDMTRMSAELDDLVDHFRLNDGEGKKAVPPRSISPATASV